MKVKQLFAVLALVSIVGCIKIAPDTPAGEEDADFVGTVTVIYEGEPFENENIRVTFMPDADGRNASIKLHRIRFVPKMPVTIDVTVPGLAVSSEAGKTVLSCERSIPWAIGGEYPKYTVTELSGEIVGEELTFSLNFGEYPTSFKGYLNK